MTFFLNLINSLWLFIIWIYWVERNFSIKLKNNHSNFGVKNNFGACQSVSTRNFSWSVTSASLSSQSGDILKFITNFAVLELTLNYAFGALRFASPNLFLIFFIKINTKTIVINMTIQEMWLFLIKTILSNKTRAGY